MKKNIAVIMGGYSKECEISILSGNTVVKYLPKNLYYVYPIYILKAGWYYENPNDDSCKIDIDKSDFSLTINSKKIYFDCVFNAIHGSPGEDGEIQAYFETYNISHTSCNSNVSKLTFSKKNTNILLKDYGIPCAKSIFLNPNDFIDENAIIKTIGLPCFIKASRSGSSFGVFKVNKKTNITPCIKKCFEIDSEVIVESFLNGREFSVGVIHLDGKSTVLPITEIKTMRRFFDYKAKYNGLSEEITPADITTQLKEKIHTIILKISYLLNLRGFHRSEFIIVNNIPHLIEVNTIPGLTLESILPKQLRRAGYDLPTFFSNLIETSLKK